MLTQPGGFHLALVVVGEGLPDIFVKIKCHCQHVTICGYMSDLLTRFTLDIWEKSPTVPVRADQAVMTTRWRRAATVTAIGTTVPIMRSWATIVTSAATSRISPVIKSTARGGWL